MLLSIIMLFVPEVENTIKVRAHAAMYNLGAVALYEWGVGGGSYMQENFNHNDELYNIPGL